LDQNARASQELAAFRKLHPEARGALAAGNGPYDAIVETWIKRLAGHGPASNQEPWTTFGGNPARNRALAVCPPGRLWVDGPTWRTRLPGRTDPDLVPRTSPAARLAFHPLIVGSQVLVGDARSVVTYDLFTVREL